ncbi:hypothetical protein FB45DRAFT_738028 [Roridomyces roridus]|uniref:F-box domain-containing protein n=1 Tax=Roridomyces roridus TaxID=1738132 RepID=A0AAD7FV86_9AGAR|nr:hypothetical protein FB45DRAFT_738028 [Roridomyces roridus]
MEQWACQRRLDAYEYPVLTLPNEITSEIFLHFLPPYPACPPLTGVASPTNLTRNCRKWRDIALALPKLWRAFSTSYTDKVEQTWFVEIWLKRSRTCPLSIQLGIRRGFGLRLPNQALLPILLHRKRWQHVALELAVNEVPLIKGPMPLLESLSLEVQELHYTHPATTADDFPRLRAVALDGTCHGKWLPISQLTSLTFEDVARASYYFPLLQMRLIWSTCI